MLLCVLGKDVTLCFGENATSCSSRRVLASSVWACLTLRVFFDCRFDELQRTIDSDRQAFEQEKKELESDRRNLVLLREQVRDNDTVHGRICTACIHFYLVHGCVCLSIALLCKSIMQP